MISKSRNARRLGYASGKRVPLFALLLTVGCAATRTGDGGRVAPPAATAVSSLMSTSDVARLEALAARRAAQPAGEGSEEGYRLGPDDLLDVRIPDLLGAAAPAAPTSPAIGGAALPAVAAAPVFQQGMRVSADGNVNIPVLGLVRAEGLTARALEHEIARRLVRAGILRAPQVSVLVAEYRSRVVAVIGSVERPGLYPVTRPGATVADLIWAAGGPGKDAGRIVQFSPALAAADPRPPATPPERNDAGTGLPIRIDLAVLLPAAGTQASGLNPQVRQGDVISIAPGGNVQVDGWIQKPGSYAVTRNLTLSGVLATAGGTNFATDRSRVMVKRVLGPGEERFFTVDLDGLPGGQAEDLPIVDGDVVYVPASSTRVVPWGMWNFVTTIFRVTAAGAAF